MRRIGNHAVVLGAGIAGLLAARILAETYRIVTVVDRDGIPTIGECRRGVPQARHLHGLHPLGQRLLDELFPGLTTTLIEQGAVTGDILGDSRWQLSGHQLAKVDIGLPALMASRPFLEGHIHTRVHALPNVTMVEHTDVVGLIAADAGRRIAGVQVHANGGGGARDLPADLVVDATGRGSRTPVWLAELSYQRPAVDRVDVGLGYASRLYRLRPGALGTDIAVVTAGTPDNPRGGALAAIEGGRHLVTLHGILGDHPPIDPAGFDDFAATLGFPDIPRALRDAQPLSDPVPFRFPASVRHRYERLRDFPAGLLLLGDAVCSFNPVYAQGMTVAALQAATLRRLLRRGRAPAPRSYFRAIARTIDTPWHIGVGADLAFPDVQGRRTAMIRVSNDYLPRLHAAAAGDAILGRAFIRVMGMLDRPETLVRPDLVLRVLRSGRETVPVTQPGGNSRHRSRRSRGCG